MQIAIEQTGRLADRQRQTDRHETGRSTYYTDRQIDGHADKQRDRHTYSHVKHIGTQKKQTARQAGKQRDRQADRQVDILIDRETDSLPYRMAD